MVKSYCVKQKKQTECVEPSGYKTAKNGRLMFWCTCAECGIKNGPSQAGGDLFDTAVGTATDLFVHHGLPWMGKKAVEMGRYYGSEALRNPKLQKKAIDYALDKLSPMIQNVGSQALDQLSTKIRPKKNYKTNRKYLDSGALDIHKAIGKLPRPAGGFSLPGHKYTGPYNDLENQVRYNPETGEILEIYDQPTGPTDAVAMQHDIDYSVCGDNRKGKNKADRKMNYCRQNRLYVTLKRRYYPDAILVAGLGENQDTDDKRLDSYKKGYTRGQPDLLVLNYHKDYKGRCIEFKSPTNNYQVSEAQKEMKKKYLNNGYAFILSNEYDRICKNIHEYMKDIR
ncbi:unnamed protein product, partial [Porites lobata]